MTTLLRGLAGLLGVGTVIAGLLIGGPASAAGPVEHPGPPASSGPAGTQPPTANHMDGGPIWWFP